MIVRNDRRTAPPPHHRRRAAATTVAGDPGRLASALEADSLVRPPIDLGRRLKPGLGLDGRLAPNPSEAGVTGTVGARGRLAGLAPALEFGYSLTVIRIPGPTGESALGAKSSHAASCLIVGT